MKFTAVLLSASALLLGSANAWWCTDYGKQANHLSCKALYPERNTFCCSAAEGGDRHTWRGDCMLAEDTPCGEGGFEGCRYVIGLSVLGWSDRRSGGSPASRYVENRRQANPSPPGLHLHADRMLKLKFVNTTNVPVQKRKIALHACDTCRRRKKRCVHPLGEGESPPSHGVHWRKRGQTSGPATSAEDGSPDDVAVTPIDPSLHHKPTVEADSGSGGQIVGGDDNDAGDDDQTADSIHVANSEPPAQNPTFPVEQPRRRSGHADPRGGLIRLNNNSTGTPAHGRVPSVETAVVPIESPAVQARDSTTHISTPEDKSHPTDSHSNHNDDRFVGDLNPEGAFLADSPATSRGHAESNAVGVWYSRRNNGGSLTPELASAVSIDYEVHQFLAVLPKNEDYEHLERIYIRDVHRILPVMNLDILRMPTSTISQVLCKQAICLAAGSNPSARPYLTLGQGSSAVLSHSEFALRLSSAIRKALSLGLVKDRVQAVAIMVILSLYTHFSQDRHLSAELAAQAVSNAQTVGLHLQNPPARSEDPAYLTRLFCCVWAMDQLNAAFHGRPVMIHERDLGRDMVECIREQDSCFRLFLEIVVLLGCIIDLYRPAAKNTGCVVMEDFPSFDSLVEKSKALGVESRLLASIELLYHGIGILSCRIPVGSTRSEHLSLALNRQALSAMKITTIIEDFGNTLSHMTFVPYAVSLSLRVAYRELRSSKVPMLTARSRRQLQSTCKTLRGMSSMFRSAQVMVDLAEQVIQEIDQVCTNAMNEQNGSGSTIAPNTPRQDQTVPQDAPAVGISNVDAGNCPPNSDTMPVFDPSLFEGPAGFDAFEFFDPGDLNAIDAILGGDAPPGIGPMGSFI
ncbi:fungal specific transcription factor domain-containing protein [Colletotrichum scovillei]|uniref:Fungal specific transcription factor domain-containing protein n=2 Tax=Colletotrichum scovillei TaxID=1209932 RepID=A0A9P7RI93_9PEZI|nr:fungal specific transcription factor domain-containing protein [Colletotrichum scovillei]KAG7077694.1 fungal specific transcription factor domain-containing protein [Colletotrichum scovillei]KAG7084676.1 fungal specific transcription factor domain-containing protein [Colletotrichum scovillei]